MLGYSVFLTTVSYLIPTFSILNSQPVTRRECEQVGVKLAVFNQHVAISIVQMITLLSRSRSHDRHCDTPKFLELQLIVPICWI